MLCISTELGIVGSRYSLHSLMGRKLQLTHGLHKTSLKLRSNKREINSSCKTKLDCLVMICSPALSPLSSWGDLLFRGLYLDIYWSVKRLATLNNRKKIPRLNNDAGSHNQKSRQFRLQVQCDQGSCPIFLQFCQLHSLLCVGFVLRLISLKVTKWLPAGNGQYSTWKSEIDFPSLPLK